MQIVGIGALDLDGGDLADLERPVRADVDGAVDLRRDAAINPRHDTRQLHRRAGKPRRSAGTVVQMA